MENGQVVRKTGKATGNYGDHWYIKNLPSGQIREYNMVTDLIDWKPKTAEKDVTIHDIMFTDKSVKE